MCPLVCVATLREVYKCPHFKGDAMMCSGDLPRVKEPASGRARINSVSLTASQPSCPSPGWLKGVSETALQGPSAQVLTARMVGHPSFWP